MAKSELIMAIEQLCDEKNIPFESVVNSIEAALAVAYRKEFGNKNLNCKVEFNPEDGSSRIFDVKEVVADPTEEELAELKEREERRKKKDFEPRKKEIAEERPTAEGQPTAESEEEKRRFNPRTDLPLTEATKMKPDAELGDQIITELTVPGEYGRVAAQTAKQVIIQKLREAERETLFNLYKDRVGEIVNATVHRVEGPMIFMDLGQATAMMPPSQQIRGERYNIGNRYKVFLLSVEKTNRGPEIIASRGAAEMVSKLFEMEVPEIASGAIEVKAIAREAGSRTKIAVKSLAENIDPIGSCVGQRGSRVQTVMGELGGEKIDIIEYNDDQVKFLVNALSPAKVMSVKLNEETKTAQAYVQEDQLSLAIGRGGQNVRLAAKLTGWKIDVLKDETVAPAEKNAAEELAPEATEEKPEEPAEEKSEAEQPATTEESAAGEEASAAAEPVEAVEAKDESKKEE